MVLLAAAIPAADWVKNNAQPSIEDKNEQKKKAGLPVFSDASASAS